MTIRIFLNRCYLPLIGVLFACNFLLFYPGMVTEDSFIQWRQAVTGLYTDEQTPIMSWWWWLLTRYVWPNHANLLAFHLLMFWAGMVALGGLFGPRALLWRYGSLGLWFLPPVMAMTGMLWKDTGLACSWFLACMLMCRCSVHGRAPSTAMSGLIIALLFYGTAVRYNAVTGLLPLCGWYALCTGVRLRGMQLLRRTVLVFASIAAATLTFNLMMIDRYNVLMAGRTMYLDLAYINKFSDVKLKPENVWQTPEAYAELMLFHPATYLSHRWMLFSQLLRMDYPYACIPYYWNRDNAKCDIALHDYKIGSTGFCVPTIEGTPRALLRDYLNAHADTPWFFGFTWLGLGALALALCLFLMRRYPAARPLALPAALLNASSVMYFSAYFFFILSCDFRYVYWSVLATSCSLFMLVGLAGAAKSAHTATGASAPAIPTNIPPPPPDGRAAP